MISDPFSRRISASRMTSGLWQTIHPVRSPCSPSAFDTDPVVIPNRVIPAMDGGLGPADAVKLGDVDDLGRFVDDVRAEVFDYENGTHRDKLEAFDAIAEIVRRSYLR